MALAILHRSHQTVTDMAYTETQKSEDRGQDAVMRTEISWLWNKENSAVFEMKVEVKLREKHYVEYYQLDIKKKLWNDILMDLMPKKETISQKRDDSGDNVGSRSTLSEHKPYHSSYVK
jgi:hypothetical protein